MAGEDSVAGARCEVEDFEGGVVGGGEEFCVAWGPAEVADGVVVRIVNCFDVVEIRSPVLDVALLSARDQPFLTM